MIVAWLAAAALAAPDGWTVTEQTYEGCELSLGPADKAGVVPMRAECWWPEVTMQSWTTKMGNWAYHDEIWTAVAQSEVKRNAGDRVLVWQRHQAKGIADREVLLWMWHETRPDGAERYAWTKASEEALLVADGRVEVAASDGYWEARPDPQGGVRIVHELRYAPGGSVPGFLVRWFQGSGFETNVAECRKAMK